MLHGRTANRGASERNFHSDYVIYYFYFYFSSGRHLKKTKQKKQTEVERRGSDSLNVKHDQT